MITFSLSLLSSFYLNQKKTLEVNPRHPLIKELLKRVEDESTDESTLDLAQVLFDTAVLRYVNFEKKKTCLFSQSNFLWCNIVSCMVHKLYIATLIN